MFIRPVIGQSSGFEFAPTRLGFYNGANNYVDRPGLGIMPANGPSLTTVMYAKLIQAGGNFNYTRNWAGAGASEMQTLNSGTQGGTGEISQFRIKNSAGIDLTNLGSVTSITMSVPERTEYAAFIITIDGTNGLWTISRNGVDVTSPGDGDFTPDGSLSLISRLGSEGSFGEAATATQGYIDVAALYITSEQIDAVADYSKFFEPSGFPKDWGSDGSGPTGTQPEHYAPSGNLSVENLGSEGLWNEIGTITPTP